MKIIKIIFCGLLFFGCGKINNPSTAGKSETRKLEEPIKITSIPKLNSELDKGKNIPDNKKENSNLVKEISENTDNQGTTSQGLNSENTDNQGTTSQGLNSENLVIQDNKKLKENKEQEEKLDEQKKRLENEQRNRKEAEDRKKKENEQREQKKEAEDRKREEEKLKKMEDENKKKEAPENDGKKQDSMEVILDKNFDSWKDDYEEYLINLLKQPPFDDKIGARNMSPNIKFYKWIKFSQSFCNYNNIIQDYYTKNTYGGEEFRKIDYGKFDTSDSQIMQDASKFFLANLMITIYEYFKKKYNIDYDISSMTFKKTEVSKFKYTVEVVLGDIVFKFRGIPFKYDLSLDLTVIFDNEKVKIEKKLIISSIFGLTQSGKSTIYNMINLANEYKNDTKSKYSLRKSIQKDGSTKYYIQDNDANLEKDSKIVGNGIESETVLCSSKVHELEDSIIVFMDQPGFKDTKQYDFINNQLQYNSNANQLVRGSSNIIVLSNSTWENEELQKYLEAILFDNKKDENNFSTEDFFYELLISSYFKELSSNTFLKNEYNKMTDEVYKDASDNISGYLIKLKSESDYRHLDRPPKNAKKSNKKDIEAEELVVKEKNKILDQYKNIYEKVIEKDYLPEIIELTFLPIYLTKERDCFTTRSEVSKFRNSWDNVIKKIAVEESIDHELLLKNPQMPGLSTIIIKTFSSSSKEQDLTYNRKANVRGIKNSHSIPDPKGCRTAFEKYKKNVNKIEDIEDYKKKLLTDLQNGNTKDVEALFSKFLVSVFLLMIEDKLGFKDANKIILNSFSNNVILNGINMLYKKFILKFLLNDNVNHEEEIVNSILEKNKLGELKISFLESKNIVETIYSGDTHFGALPSLKLVRYMSDNEDLYPFATLLSNEIFSYNESNNNNTSEFVHYYTFISFMIALKSESSLIATRLIRLMDKSEIISKILNSNDEYRKNLKEILEKFKSEKNYYKIYDHLSEIANIPDFRQICFRAQTPEIQNIFDSILGKVIDNLLKQIEIIKNLETIDTAEKLKAYYKNNKEIIPLDLLFKNKKVELNPDEIKKLNSDNERNLYLSAIYNSKEKIKRDDKILQNLSLSEMIYIVSKENSGTKVIEDLEAFKKSDEGQSNLIKLYLLTGLRIDNFDVKNYEVFRDIVEGCNKSFAYMYRAAIFTKLKSEAEDILKINEDFREILSTNIKTITLEQLSNIKNRLTTIEKKITDKVNENNDKRPFAFSEEVISKIEYDKNISELLNDVRFYK